MRNKLLDWFIRKMSKGDYTRLGYAIADLKRIFLDAVAAILSPVLDAVERRLRRER